MRVILHYTKCGDQNLADLLIKHLDGGKPDKFYKMLGYETMEGVDKLTLKAAQARLSMALDS